MQEHGVFSGIDPQSGPIAPESIEQPRMNAEVFPRLLGVDAVRTGDVRDVDKLAGDRRRYRMGMIMLSRFFLHASHSLIAGWPELLVLSTGPTATDGS
jgi:hypothetical protein